MKWFYECRKFDGNNHMEIKIFGGRIHANQSKIYNPGTWFIYFGEFLRISVNKKDQFGLGVKKLHGALYYHFFWNNGQIGWHFPWKKFAVGN